MAGNRKTFHTFDSLRFFAFFKVFLLHLPVLAIPGFSFIKTGGGIGVLLIFASMLSYKLIEKPFLNLKKYFS